jgi:hypothetical protein
MEGVGEEITTSGSGPATKKNPHAVDTDIERKDEEKIFFFSSVTGGKIPTVCIFLE